MHADDIVNVIINFPDGKTFMFEHVPHVLLYQINHMRGGSTAAIEPCIGGSYRGKLLKPGQIVKVPEQINRDPYLRQDDSVSAVLYIGKTFGK